MASFKAGDRVEIVAREQTTEDITAGMYYPYFGHLTGTVDRVYEDKTICVEVDLDSLPEGIRKRHLEVQDTNKNRWLKGLSDEAQSKLSEADKQFRMSYKILVSAKDLVPGKGPKKAASKQAAKASPEAAAEKPAAAPESKAKPAAEAPKRLTEKDLEAKELEFLKEKQRKSGGL
jgi:hypothetical protein